MKTYLINTITNDVEAGPGTVQEMVDAANAAINDGADHEELKIATVTHSFVRPPAVAVVANELANANSALTEIAQS